MFGWQGLEFIVLPIMLIGIILIAILLGVLLKNKSENIKAIPLQIITIIILILEIIKQIKNIQNGFSTWALPFHYCSMFVFFFPLSQFSKGKVKLIMKPVTFICGLTMLFAFYCAPSLIIGDSSSNVFTSFSNFHTFTFHHLVILYVILSLTLNNYKSTRKDYLYVMLVMASYCVLGITLSHILDTNYCNFLTSNIILMEKIRVSIGQVGYSIIMFIFITFGTTFLTFLYRKVEMLIMDNKNMKEK